MSKTKKRQGTVGEVTFLGLSDGFAFTSACMPGGELSRRGQPSGAVQVTLAMLIT